ncbi:MAG: DnaD domain protein [Ruminococcaceae bacterium]|nr:DnaD domain protein [Oscillospiraceae bacterium]
MKKNEKINLTIKTPLSQSVWNALASADENDLRVMLALALASEGEREDIDGLLSKLELEAGELDASIKYWCGAGLLKKGRKSAKAASGDTAKREEPKKTAEPLHRGGKLERKSEMPSYSSTELAELIEKRSITAEFINEAQRVVGKIFNTHEVNILVGMIDYIGFDEASVIIILSHMVNLGKRSLRYAEQLAFSLYDEGITDAEALQLRLKKMEGYTKTESEVRAMFGMTGRSLTTKEKKFLRAWIENMGFDTEVIRLAYDITVDAIHEPAPAYANSILEGWYALGLTTTEAIAAAEDEKKQKKKATKPDGNSFDTDEFFEAALRRTFEEL